MDEYWELVDREGKPSGIIQKRGGGEPIPEGLFRPGVQIYSVTEQGKILITKRHPRKVFGNEWEFTEGGCQKGETRVQSAKRELSEETGICVGESELISVGTVFEMREKCMAEHFLLILREEPKLTLQETEVVDSRFVSFAELEKQKDKIVGRVWERFLHDKAAILAELEKRGITP